MKVFLDTNVLVSGFATRGPCADVIRLVLAEHELVIGADQVSGFLITDPRGFWTLEKKRGKK